MHATRLAGRWSSADGTAAGCSNFGRYARNPRYALRVPGGGAKVTARLRATGALVARGAVPPALNLALYRAGADLDRPRKGDLAATANGGVYTNSPCGVALPLQDLDDSGGGGGGADEYVLVPSTFQPRAGRFDLVVYCSRKGLSIRQVA